MTPEEESQKDEIKWQRNRPSGQLACFRRVQRQLPELDDGGDSAARKMMMETPVEFFKMFRSLEAEFREAWGGKTKEEQAEQAETPERSAEKDAQTENLQEVIRRLVESWAE